MLHCRLVMSRLLEDPELGGVGDLVLKSSFTTASLPLVCDKMCSCDWKVYLHLQAPSVLRERWDPGEGWAGDHLPVLLLKPSTASGTLLRDLLWDCRGFPGGPRGMQVARHLSGCQSTGAPEIGVHFNHLCTQALVQGFKPVVLNSCVAWMNEQLIRWVDWVRWVDWDITGGVASPAPSSLICSRLGDGYSPGLPSERRRPSCFGRGLRYSVCTGCSWREEPQCLRGEPSPGWGQVQVQSDRLGKEEGRKGCSRGETVALKVFLLDFFVCSEWRCLLRSTLNTWWKCVDKLLVKSKCRSYLLWIHRASCVYECLLACLLEGHLSLW